MQGKSLQEAMRANTSTEFVVWRQWLRQQWKRRTADQYYLAAIVAELRRSRGVRSTLDGCALEFRYDDEPVKKLPVDMVKATWRARMRANERQKRHRRDG